MQYIYRILLVVITPLGQCIYSMQLQETAYKAYYRPPKKKRYHKNKMGIYAGYYTHNSNYLSTRGELRHALFGLRKYLRDTYQQSCIIEHNMPICEDKISFDAYKIFEGEQAEYVVSTMHNIIRQECNYIHEEMEAVLPESSPLHITYIPELGYIYRHPERLIDLYANNSPERRLSSHTRMIPPIPSQALQVSRNTIGSHLSPRKSNYDSSPTSSDSAYSPRFGSHSPPQHKSWNTTLREYFRKT